MMAFGALTVVLVAALLGEIRGLSPLGRKGASRETLYDEANGRLPLTLDPYHYNLQIRPDIYLPDPPFVFSGHVQIYFTAVNVTDVITLNYKGLVIDSGPVQVSVAPGSPGNPLTPVISSVSFNPDAEFVYITLTETLAQNAKYTVDLDFSGVITNDYFGLYYDFYTGADGQTKYMAATQLEQHGGREMFPSFDEPDFKSTFNTTVDRRPPAVVVSNMPLLQTIDRGDGWVSDVFGQSPYMALYLVCIAVGDLEAIPAGTINGYEMNIWSRPELIPQLTFVHNTAPLIQTWLDFETGITYREPKSDHIAIPNMGGAMENWGLITYGEQYFAINPETSAASGRQTVGSILAHEMAHLWYGDLVTTKWWDDAWLNEGFASYYDYRPTAAIGWEGSEMSQTDVQRFLDNDQRNTSDPVRKDIPTVWNGNYAFSGSTYPKGGAMVHQLEGILTNPVLKRGLNRYLQRHQYDNAITDYLWQALTEQAAIDGITNPDGSPLDIKLRMDPWLNQMGFPLVTVIRSADGTATLVRSHFLRPPGQIMETASPYNYQWDVPITVVTADSEAADWDAPPSAWIDFDALGTVISGLPTDLNRWAIINAKFSFYYRVWYDTLSHSAIVSQLIADNTVIHVETRSQFIDDSFSVARAGYSAEISAMETTRYLASEAKWSPWFSALRHLKLSDRFLRKLPWGGLQRNYILGLAVPVYQALGWTYISIETPLEQFLRRDMISVTCTYGYSECLSVARSQYALIVPDPSDNVVDPNNLPTVLCVGVNEGNVTDWQLSFDQYILRQSSQIREERYAYLFGCSCTSDPALLDRLLVELGTTVASRDRNLLAQYLSQTTYGAQILWNYLKTNWNALPFGVNRMTQLKNIASGFSTQAELDNLLTFRTNHPPTARNEVNSYRNLILDVEANIEWVATESASLEQWLLAHQPAGIKVETRNGKAYELSGATLEHWDGIHQSYRSELLRH